MAHLDKVAGGWRQVLNHDYRLHTDNRENINKDLSYLNYDLIDRKDPWQFVEEKIKESKLSGGRFQDGTVILCECVVTVPIDFTEDERLFFEICKQVLDKHFGKDNCASAIVHRDEPGARSHLHYKAVPMIEKEKKYKKDKNGKTKPPKIIKQFSAKDLLNKSYLSYFHDQLQAELEETFKCSVNVKTDGSTKSQRQEIVELKEKIIEQTEIIREQKAIIKEKEEIIKEQNKFISAAKSLLINGRSVFQMIMEHMRKSLLRRKIESSSVINKEKEIDIEL